MIEKAIAKIVNTVDLSFGESVEVMTEIMEGRSTPAQLGAFLTALKMKGEVADEVAGMASVMRAKSTRIDVPDDVIDTCGTGGDGKGTFNVSTAAAFVAAGAGIKVAKHGNRAMSGSTGSADVLEALGIDIQITSEGVAECIGKTGFGFMFAQGYHPSMRHAAPTRKEIGVPTVFNILGPLTNPAGAKRQLIGVSDKHKGALIADVLKKLGSERAVVVSGEDGLDEITLDGASILWLLESGSIEEHRIRPQDFNLEESTLDVIKVNNAIESADVIRDILNGRVGPARDIVLMNASAALLASGRFKDLETCLVECVRSIDCGLALNVLENCINYRQGPE